MCSIAENDSDLGGGESAYGPDKLEGCTGGGDCGTDNCQAPGTPPTAGGCGPAAGRLCGKCHASAAEVVVRQKEGLCRACLEAAVAARVRQTLLRIRDAGVSHGPPPVQRIMVALSGGPASMALLHVLLLLKSSSTGRPQRGKVGVPAETSLSTKARFRQCQETSEPEPEPEPEP